MTKGKKKTVLAWKTIHLPEEQLNTSLFLRGLPALELAYTRLYRQTDFQCTPHPHSRRQPLSTFCL